MELLYIILGIILGWLLGLLTQPIVTQIERVYKRKDFRFAIVSELKNLVVRLAANFYKIGVHLGTLDKQSVRWVMEMYQKYSVDHKQQMFLAAKQLLEMDDQEFQSALSARKAADNISLSLKTFPLLFIDCSFDIVSVFDSEFQRKILEIKAQIDMLNQQILESRDYFYLTFNPESLSANQQILRENIKNLHGYIQDKCKQIAGMIEEVINT